MMITLLRDDARIIRAREKLAAAKHEFSRVAALALKGKANPQDVGKALHAVDIARAALRRAALAMRGAR